MNGPQIRDSLRRWGRRAVTDGGRWKDYWEFNNGAPVQLLSVVAGGPGGRHALRVLQRGPSYAAFVQRSNILAPSKDYYVRNYMRKMGSAAGWRFVISAYGCPSAVYPLIHLGPSMVLAHGVWYRFEYHVDFVDPTHMQVHVRVYDAAGVQILGDADFRQSDYGNTVWNGRSDWTLASLYAAGHSFCVNPVALTKFAMGNNGQKDAVDTRLAWYYAGLQIRTDWWPGR